MKPYEKIAQVEKRLFRLNEDLHAHRADLAGWDTRMEKEQQRFDSFVETYNEVVKNKQALFARIQSEIETEQKHLEESLEEQIVAVEKQKGRSRKKAKQQSVEIISEPSEESERSPEEKTLLLQKKKDLEEKLQRLKELTEKGKKETEEVKEVIEDISEELIDEEKIQEGQINILKEYKEVVNGDLKELESGKVQCPECGEFFTKGGAFASHYKSHFNNGDSD